MNKLERLMEYVQKCDLYKYYEIIEAHAKTFSKDNLHLLENILDMSRRQMNTKKIQRLMSSINKQKERLVVKGGGRTNKNPEERINYTYDVITQYCKDVLGQRMLIYMDEDQHTILPTISEMVKTNRIFTGVTRYDKGENTHLELLASKDDELVMMFLYKISNLTGEEMFTSVTPSPKSYMRQLFKHDFERQVFFSEESVIDCVGSEYLFPRYINSKNKLDPRSIIDVETTIVSLEDDRRAVKAMEQGYLNKLVRIMNKGFDNEKIKKALIQYSINMKPKVRFHKSIKLNSEKSVYLKHDLINRVMSHYIATEQYEKAAEITTGLNMFNTKNPEMYNKIKKAKD